MAIVWIPSLLQNITDGQKKLSVPGNTVHDVVAELDKNYPGFAMRLCEDGQLRPGIAVVVDNLVSNTGLRQSVAETSEVHFIPAQSGG